jgi:hypothetical protein
MCPFLRLAPPSSRTPAISYSLTWCRQPTCTTSQPLQLLSRVRRYQINLGSGSGGLKPDVTLHRLSAVHISSSDRVCLYTLPFSSDSSINTYSSILPPLRTRFSALHGGRLVIQRSTVLDVPPYTSRYHISSSYASIIYIQQSSLLLFVFVVWDGMVWGVRARQGQRQAYWSRAGCIFGV